LAKTYGGRGATVMGNSLSPGDGACAHTGDRQLHGARIAGPTLIHWGTEEQKKRYIPPFSRVKRSGVRATLSPEPFQISLRYKLGQSKKAMTVINGQKVWTSYAQYARYCLLLARTDPTVPKHKGISLAS
jgi:alkylation response protein AidB-like acyl-CoA dehydrogenase